MSSKKTSWIIELVDRVTRPIRNVQNTVNLATADWTKHTHAVSASESGYSKFAKIIGGIGLTAMFTSLAQQSMEFENSMMKSNTIMKQTPAQFSKVTDSVRELSKTIPIARQQLAEGLYEVLSAGVPENNAVQFLADSAKAAVGGSAELPTLIRTTTTVLKSFNMEFSKAGFIQDKLQKSVDIGSMSMNELAQALPKVSVSAAQLGVNVDELLGGFATMSGVTGDANEVGTQLNAVLTALIKPTAEATEMAKKLGVELDANAIKKSGGLVKFLDLLMAKVWELSDTKHIPAETIIGQLFGREEAIKAVMALSGQMSKDWAKNTDLISNSVGSVKTAFGIMAETGMSKMELLKNKGMAAFDSLFKIVAPILIQITDLLSSVFGALERFSIAHPAIAQLIVDIASVLVIATAFTGVLKLVTAATWLFSAALWANPITWIIASVVALIAGIVLLIKHFDKVKEWFSSYAKWFKYLNPFGPLIALYEFVMPNLKKAWHSFWDNAGAALKPFKSVIDGILYPIKEAIKFLDKMLGAVDDLSNKANSIEERTRPKIVSDKVLRDSAPMRGGTAQQRFLNAQVEKFKNRKIEPMGIYTKGNAPSNAAGMDVSGGTKGAAVITFSNKFDITINGDAEAGKNLAEKVMSEIADQLQDAAIISTR